MANFNPQEIDLSLINSGARYEDGDTPSAETFNAPIEASAWAQEKVKELGERVISQGATVKFNGVPQSIVNFDSDPQDQIHNLSATISNIVGRIYPIGSIYISLSETNPLETLIENSKWVKIENKFLVGSGSVFPFNTIGGTIVHNHRLPIGFDESNKLYLWKDTLGLPVFGSDISQGQFGGTPITVGTQSGDLRYSLTENSSNIPPYLAVNMWQRTE